MAVAIPVIPSQQAPIVYPGFENLDVGHVAAHQHDLREVLHEDRGDREHERDGYDREDRGDGYVPHLRELAGAVDDRVFVEARVDGGQCGEVDDRAPAHGLPDAAGDEHDADPFPLPGDVVVGEADGAEQPAQNAGVFVENHVEEGGYDHPVEEMRKVEHRLRRALQRLVAHVVEQQRQEDDDGEPEEQPGKKVISTVFRIRRKNRGVRNSTRKYSHPM